MSDTTVIPDRSADQNDADQNDADQNSADRTESAELCATCPHPRADHDAISARFCVATVAGGYSRGCVCTPSTMKGSRLNL